MWRALLARQQQRRWRGRRQLDGIVASAPSGKCGGMTSDIIVGLR
ncbi:MAG: hypothetical protein U0350_35530 [Caldilineaceae bacterium]